jgi:mono/diheme cytochrome c family protein
MRWGQFLSVVCIALLAFAGCASENYPVSSGSTATSLAPDASSATDSASSGAALPRGPATCRQAHAESLPARLAAVHTPSDAGAADAAQMAPTGTTYFVSDLFERFKSVCGACHGTVQGLGGFQIQSAGDFQAQITDAVLQHVQSDGPSGGHLAGDPSDPNDPMPPFPPGGPGKPYSKRDDTDPVREFAELVKEWLKESKPKSFEVVSTTMQAAPTTGSTIPTTFIGSADIGNAMTNIGNCIPTRELVGTEQTTSAKLDAMFAAANALPAGPGVSAAQMIGLPEHLRDTDLFTLDSALLAPYGVIAFAPGYPLWSDNANKLRHVRVPRGTSVQFDKAKQGFTVPPNTRFYKTFMKLIVDADGSIRNRKIETRLIVARPDRMNADGTTTPAALFGSYKWNDDESDAVLVQTPLKSGDPFADTVLQYVTDEQLAADLLKANPADPEVALLEGQAARHYAIPSSARCIQCHMGSATGTFSLGFLPLQINRRPEGEGGVFEPSGPDELTQLQRFIDYGIITGMDSPSDVLPLEAAEGSRAPRNQYELLAQGYMLGNCSHCHNPRGYPSQLAPVLRDVLNFLPGPDGGIFQFPLERTSPRIFRGATGQAQIPYITPSLMDQPRFDFAGLGVKDPFQETAGFSGMEGDYLYKALYAPWRSLIYRNVDDSFAYTDDLALFPHMPMNTPGFDPRARQYLSDWMVSIPAIRKSPEIPEYAFFSDQGTSMTQPTFGGSSVDRNTQPYAEVFPGDPRYPAALDAASKRLNVLHTGVNPDVPTNSDPANPKKTAAHPRYSDSIATDDILDPAVLADPICHAVPTPAQTYLHDPVPSHPHWVITDATQPPGDWTPRRPDWIDALVKQNAASQASSCVAAESQTLAQEDEARAVRLLQNIPPLAGTTLDYLTKPLPFGLWQKKSACKFTSVPTVGSFAGANRPLWMDIAPGLLPTDPVYEQSPGQAVFKMICINCHGAKADSNGRLAQNLATMTGGLAQVADFRDGLFGRVGTDESDIHRVFGASGLPPGIWTAPSLTDDDRASRYMAWMALGGTKVHIPGGILQIVALTQVLDQHREASAGGQALSANMLSTAKSLCMTLLGCHDAWGEICTLSPANVTSYSKTLLHTNGDAELWLRLCSLNNPPPVHVVQARVIDKPFNPSNGSFVVSAGNLIRRDVYLNYAKDHPEARIGGNASQSLDDDNYWPWCEGDHATAQASQQPECPPGFADGANSFSYDEAQDWAVRGAINAGLAVFSYVRSLEKSDPPADYNQCEQLP